MTGIRFLYDGDGRAGEDAKLGANQMGPPAEAISSMAICVACSGTET